MARIEANIVCGTYGKGCTTRKKCSNRCEADKRGEYMSRQKDLSSDI